MKAFASVRWSGLCSKICAMAAGIVVSHFTRVTAVITTVCFVMTAVCGQVIAAVSREQQSAAYYEKTVSGFALPNTVGRVTDAKFHGSGTVVVAIQDLHCHPEVQKNISRVLSFLRTDYGVKSVYLEGAWGTVDTGWLSSIKDKAARREITENLVNSGQLTGVEYFAANCDAGCDVRGLENEKIYKENSLRLKGIMDNRSDVDAILTEVERNVAAARARFFNTRQNKMENLITRHKAGEMESGKYYRMLTKYGKSLQLPVEAYTNINGFLNLLELEKGINYKKLSRELNDYVKVLRQTLPYAAYQSLVERTANFSKIDELYMALSGLSKIHQVSMDSRFPEVARFFRYLETGKQVNPLALIKEENHLVSNINYALSINKTQQEIVFLCDFSRCLKDFYSNKITAEDYDYFTANLKEFNFLYEVYGSRNTLARLQPYYTLYNDYYKANVERNTCFVNNILSDKPASGSNACIAASGSEADKVCAALSTAKDIRIVVTGGFHTAGMTGLLDKSGVSYLTITPSVTQDTKKSDMIYARILEQQNKILSQAFAFIVASLRWDEQTQLLIKGALPGIIGEVSAGRMTVGDAESKINRYMGQTIEYYEDIFDQHPELRKDELLKKLYKQIKGSNSENRALNVKLGEEEDGNFPVTITMPNGGQTKYVYEPKSDTLRKLGDSAPSKDGKGPDSGPSSGLITSILSSSLLILLTVLTYFGISRRTMPMTHEEERSGVFSEADIDLERFQADREEVIPEMRVFLKLESDKEDDLAKRLNKLLEKPGLIDQYNVSYNGVPDEINLLNERVLKAIPDKNIAVVRQRTSELNYAILKKLFPTGIRSVTVTVAERHSQKPDLIAVKRELVQLALIIKTYEKIKDKDDNDNEKYQQSQKRFNELAEGLSEPEINEINAIAGLEYERVDLEEIFERTFRPNIKKNLKKKIESLTKVIEDAYFLAGINSNEPNNRIIPVKFFAKETLLAIPRGFIAMLVLMCASWVFRAPEKKIIEPQMDVNGQSLESYAAGLPYRTIVDYAVQMQIKVWKLMGDVWAMVRPDWNVGIGKDGKVKDDERILASKPQLMKNHELGLITVIAVHLGKPQKAANKGTLEWVAETSLDAIIEHIREKNIFPGVTIHYKPTWYTTEDVWEDKEYDFSSIKPGDFVILNNARQMEEEEMFGKLEKKKEELAALKTKVMSGEATEGDKAKIETLAGEISNIELMQKRMYGRIKLFILEGMGIAHRLHLSTGGAFKHILRVMGIGMLNDLRILDRLLEKEELVLILGGAKVDEKIDVLKDLGPNKKVEKIIPGGGILNLLLAAFDVNIGQSLGSGPAFKEKVDTLKELLKDNPEIVSKIVWPEYVTLLMGTDLNTESPEYAVCRLVMNGVSVPKGLELADEDIDAIVRENYDAGNWMIADIDPAAYVNVLDNLSDKAGVIGNGTIGVSDKKNLEKMQYGTKAVIAAMLRAAAKNGTYCLVGGGDAIQARADFIGYAAEMLGMTREEALKYIDVVTGGGSALEYLRKGKPLAEQGDETLPAIKELSTKTVEAEAKVPGGTTATTKYSAVAPFALMGALPFLSQIDPGVVNFVFAASDTPLRLIDVLMSSNTVILAAAVMGSIFIIASAHTMKYSRHGALLRDLQEKKKDAKYVSEKIPVWSWAGTWTIIRHEDKTNIINKSEKYLKMVLAFRTLLKAWLLIIAAVPIMVYGGGILVPAGILILTLDAVVISPLMLVILLLEDGLLDELEYKYEYHEPYKVSEYKEINIGLLPLLFAGAVIIAAFANLTGAGGPVDPSALVNGASSVPLDPAGLLVSIFGIAGLTTKRYGATVIPETGESGVFNGADIDLEQFKAELENMPKTMRLFLKLEADDVDKLAKRLNGLLEKPGLADQYKANYDGVPDEAIARKETALNEAIAGKEFAHVPQLTRELNYAILKSIFSEGLPSVTVTTNEGPRDPITAKNKMIQLMVIMLGCEKGWRADRGGTDAKGYQDSQKEYNELASKFGITEGDRREIECIAGLERELSEKKRELERTFREPRQKVLKNEIESLTEQIKDARLAAGLTATETTTGSLIPGSFFSNCSMVILAALAALLHVGGPSGNGAGGHNPMIGPADGGAGSLRQKLLDDLYGDLTKDNTAIDWRRFNSLSSDEAAYLVRKALRNGSVEAFNGIIDGYFLSDRINKEQPVLSGRLMAALYWAYSKEGSSFRLAALEQLMREDLKWEDEKLITALRKKMVIAEKPIKFKFEGSYYSIGENGIEVRGDPKKEARDLTESEIGLLLVKIAKDEKNSFGQNDHNGQNSRYDRVSVFTIVLCSIMEPRKNGSCVFMELMNKNSDFEKYLKLSRLYFKDNDTVSDWIGRLIGDNSRRPELRTGYPPSLPIMSAMIVLLVMALVSGVSAMPADMAGMFGTVSASLAGNPLQIPVIMAVLISVLFSIESKVLPNAVSRNGVGNQEGERIILGRAEYYALLKLEELIKSGDEEKIKAAREELEKIQKTKRLFDALVRRMRAAGVAETWTRLNLRNEIYEINLEYQTARREIEHLIIKAEEFGVEMALRRGIRDAMTFIPARTYYLNAIPESLRDTPIAGKTVVLLTNDPENTVAARLELMGRVGGNSLCFSLKPSGTGEYAHTFHFDHDGLKANADVHVRKIPGSDAAVVSFHVTFDNLEYGSAELDDRLLFACSQAYIRLLAEKESSWRYELEKACGFSAGIQPAVMELHLSPSADYAPGEELAGIAVVGPERSAGTLAGMTLESVVKDLLSYVPALRGRKAEKGVTAGYSGLVVEEIIAGSPKANIARLKNMALSAKMRNVSIDLLLTGAAGAGLAEEYDEFISWMRDLKIDSRVFVTVHSVDAAVIEKLGRRGFHVRIDQHKSPVTTGVIEEIMSSNPGMKVMIAARAGSTEDWRIFCGLHGNCILESTIGSTAEVPSPIPGIVGSLRYDPESADAPAGKLEMIARSQYQMVVLPGRIIAKKYGWDHLTSALMEKLSSFRQGVTCRLLEQEAATAGSIVNDLGLTAEDCKFAIVKMTGHWAPGGRASVSSRLLDSYDEYRNGVRDALAEFREEGSMDGLLDGLQGGKWSVVKAHLDSLRGDKLEVEKTAAFIEELMICLTAKAYPSKAQFARSEQEHAYNAAKWRASRSIVYYDGKAAVRVPDGMSDEDGRLMKMLVVKYFLIPEGLRDEARHLLEEMNGVPALHSVRDNGLAAWYLMYVEALALYSAEGPRDENMIRTMVSTVEDFGNRHDLDRLPVGAQVMLYNAASIAASCAERMKADKSETLCLKLAADTRNRLKNAAGDPVSTGNVCSDALFNTRCAAALSRCGGLFESDEQRTEFLREDQKIELDGVPDALIPLFMESGILNLDSARVRGMVERSREGGLEAVALMGLLPVIEAIAEKKSIIERLETTSNEALRALLAAA